MTAQTRAKGRVWSLDILVIADDAVPAAERLKNVAPGASPGYPCRETLSPGRGERSAPCLSPLRG